MGLDHEEHKCQDDGSKCPWEVHVVKEWFWASVSVHKNSSLHPPCWEGQRIHARLSQDKGVRKGDQGLFFPNIRDTVLIHFDFQIKSLWLDTILSASKLFPLRRPVRDSCLGIPREELRLHLLSDSNVSTRYPQSTPQWSVTPHTYPPNHWMPTW